ncbi:hypothetical protein KY290_027877 [Solanum tuberosum]|uniref:Uncharacterized protein n=1 Tax=Solanum tuberosum TaxID=4113 RepID=A0ABQ7UJI0_SOLTU|nr:hypothetical protein KY290_027877 [Solanum tuberosum]
MGDDLVTDGELLVIKGIIVSCEPNVPEAKEDEGVPVHPLIEIIIPQRVPLIYPVIFINFVSDCSPLIVALKDAQATHDLVVSNGVPVEKVDFPFLSCCPPDKVPLNFVHCVSDPGWYPYVLHHVRGHAAESGLCMNYPTSHIKELGLPSSHFLSHVFNDVVKVSIPRFLMENRKTQVLTKGFKVLHAKSGGTHDSGLSGGVF